MFSNDFIDTVLQMQKNAFNHFVQVRMKLLFLVEHFSQEPLHQNNSRHRTSAFSILPAYLTSCSITASNNKIKNKNNRKKSLIRI